MPYSHLPGYGNTGRHRPVPSGNSSWVTLRTQPLPRFQSASRPSSLNESQPLLARQPRSFKRPLLILAVVAVFAFASLYDFSGNGNMVQAAFDSKGMIAARQAAEEQHRMDAYKQTINQIVAAHRSENIAVSTIDLSNNQALTLGDQGTFTAASTTKLITAITLLRDVEHGQASLDAQVDGQTVGTHLQNMVVNSDNDAWHALNYDYLSHEALKEYMASIGFPEYDPDVNTIYPADMAKILQRLYQGQLLNKTHTKLLLSYMQQANKREYIVDNTPAGYTVYHKAGWLDGLMHDVAIVSKGHKTIVLAIYTFNGTDQSDTPANQQLFKQITSATLHAYF